MDSNEFDYSFFKICLGSSLVESLDPVSPSPRMQKGLPGLEENTVVLSYPRFCFPRFQLPVVNWGPKILNAKFQKQTIHTF